MLWWSSEGDEGVWNQGPDRACCNGKETLVRFDLVSLNWEKFLAGT